MPREGMAGVVLAGGESSRFGSEKASALFEGRTLFDRVTAAVGAACSPLIVVAPRGRVLPGAVTPFERVDDVLPGEGPLPALLAAFERLATGFAFATSCDAPLLTAEAIPAIGLPAAGDARAVSLDGRAQPLFAVYDVGRTLAVLRDLVASGERRLNALLRQLEVETFEPPPDDRNAYRSANTPEELHALETLARRQRGSGAGAPG